MKSHKPDSFCSTILVASSTHIRYAIGTAAETGRVWLARLTCLLGRSNKSQAGKILIRKTMYEMVQKTPKQQSPQRKFCHNSRRKSD